MQQCTLTLLSALEARISLKEEPAEEQEEYGFAGVPFDRNNLPGIYFSFADLMPKIRDELSVSVLELL